ncbi:MAG: T9SS type A sorting domain-containing protein [Saprospiraceae bacterium]|nr:T9SS type A sorting domain-containing protein [Saprospiraceae bacterium]
MKKATLLFFFFYLSCLPVFSQQAAYSRVKILLNERNVFQLARLGIDVTHGELAIGRFFISDFSAEELAHIRAAGFQTEVLIEDVQAHYIAQNESINSRNPPNECPGAQERYPYETPSQFALGSMAGYFTYQEMLDILDSMAARYPQLVSVKAPIENGQSVEGRPIYWLRITDNPNTVEPQEKEVLYTGLHHAREPGGLSALIFFMWYLLENYDTDAEIQFLLNNTALYFIPCVNPDGYIYNELTNPAGGGLWRKNRKLNYDNTYGVDLNRNYGYQWGFDNIGSSYTPPSSVYRGTGPFSEPETKAVRDFCYQRKFITALNYHTYGNLLVYPWGYSDTPTAEAVTFDAFAEAMTLQNNFRAGTGTETVGYVVNGNSDDWMYGEFVLKPRTYSMTPEVGTEGFWPPVSSIIENCKATMLMSLTAAALPHRYGRLKPTNSSALTAVEGEITFKLKRYGLADGPFTVSLSPISDNIIAAGSPSVLQPAPYETLENAIAYTLDGSNLKEGDEVLFLLTLDNGQYAKQDTIRCFFMISPPVFEDQSNTLGNWEPATGQWGLTGESYFSFPTSITDSPSQDYDNNASSFLELGTPLTLTDFDRAFLFFRARWDIEPAYDYAQVLISVNGGDYIPLCGKYTTTGGQFQSVGLPVYDGLNQEWVAEEIDLTPYVQPGDQLSVAFSLISDGFNTRDGFYFDDVSIFLTDSLLTSVQSLPATQFRMAQNFPNPAQNYTLVSIEKANDAVFNSGKLVVLNALGQQVWHQPINGMAPKQTLRIDLSGWESGVYFYQIEADGRKTAARRFCVAR